MAKTKTTPMESKMTAFLRLNVFSFSGLRVGAGADSCSSCPVSAGGLRNGYEHIIRELRERRPTSAAEVAFGDLSSLRLLTGVHVRWKRLALKPTSDRVFTILSYMPRDH